VPYDDSSSTVLGLYLITAAFSLLIFIDPLVKRSSILSTMFISIDRPQDRPYTITWMVTQFIIGYAIIIPLSLLFQSIGRASLVGVPGIVNGFGDGLAEPMYVFVASSCVHDHND
jgi:hypothetical protein